jgi:hypothetical protein
MSSPGYRSPLPSALKCARDAGPSRARTSLPKTQISYHIAKHHPQATTRIAHEHIIARARAESSVSSISRVEFSNNDPPPTGAKSAYFTSSSTYGPEQWACAKRGRRIHSRRDWVNPSKIHCKYETVSSTIRSTLAKPLTITLLLQSKAPKELYPHCQ